jgi:hypothetical protein
MPNPPDHDFVSQMRMDGVLRFREYGDCLYSAEDEVLKLYRPKSVRRIGGRTGDRVQMGDIGFVLRADVAALPASRPLTPPSSLSICPLMNLPELVRFAAISDGHVSDEFVTELGRYLRALPSTNEQIRTRLGEEFLSRNALERVPVLARFLRSVPTSNG